MLYITVTMITYELLIDLSIFWRFFNWF